MKGTDVIGHVDILESTRYPQTLITVAAKGCRVNNPTAASEAENGEWVVNKLLQGDRGHYGPLEHPTISFKCEGFSHSLMQQARTHRFLTFDVRSFRAPLKTTDSQELGDLFYLPEAYHKPEFRGLVEVALEESLETWKILVAGGMKPEDARFILPGYALRQNFVVSGNLRAWWHFLDMRLKGDAQAEIRQFSEQVDHLLGYWVPELQAYYREKRGKRARLSP